ncbi:hypothetical protein GCM10028824_23580 [Hymenobacter segetis]|uniref:DUF1735 domain-containing protein n=1 Tax=Hymenobacter segetis TaxID=2025509 RepID=A0ABU9LVB8_9BACT
MKKLLFSLLPLALLAGTSSCRDQARIPEPVVDSVPLILPEINPKKSYFDVTASRLSINSATASNIARPVFEFVVNPSKGQAEIQTVELYKSYLRGSRLGPRVKVRDLTSFPVTITMDSQEAIADLYPSSPITGQTAPLPIKATTASAINRIELPTIAQSAIVFTFEYVMKDGRRIVLTPLSTTEGTVGAPTGTMVNAPYAAVALFK